MGHVHLDFSRSVFCAQKNASSTEYCVSYPELDFVRSEFRTWKWVSYSEVGLFRIKLRFVLRKKFLLQEIAPRTQIWVA